MARKKHTSERYCSDRLNPDLLRSELTWCAGMSTRVLCASVHSTKPERRRRGDRNEAVP
jgi:hypothetical protein